MVLNVHKTLFYQLQWEEDNKEVRNLQQSLAQEEPITPVKRSPEKQTDSNNNN